MQANKLLAITHASLKHSCLPEAFWELEVEEQVQCQLQLELHQEGNEVVACVLGGDPAH